MRPGCAFFTRSPSSCWSSSRGDGPGPGDVRMRFAEMTAPEIRVASRENTLVLAPIAACEQHSRHLPVFTDSILVGAVAEGVEHNLGDRLLLLPVLWLGASEHHLPFGGTLTATLPTYEQLLVDLLTPLLRDGFRRVLLLN